MVRTLIPQFRMILAALKKCDAPVADGAVISRMFEACIKVLTVMDSEPRELPEVAEALCGAMLEVNLHVFQEVWTQKIDFFFAQAEKHP